MGGGRLIEREALISELRATGLRERGGAGLLVAERWQALRDAPGEQRYAVCNAVDGAPHVPTARFLLGSDPEAVIEGLLIAAQAIGATRGVVGVNAGHSEETARLERAIEQVGRRWRLEAGEAGTALPCDLTILELPGSLVSAEETAIIRALESRQPLPYLRGDGEVRGVHGAPTLVETAETLAAVAAVFREGAAAPEVSTVVMTVSGDVSRQRTFRVSLGATVASVLEQAEGADLGELRIKAVQLGGPTGRFVAGDCLDKPIAFGGPEQPDSARDRGDIAGGIEVFGGGRCAVEMARDAIAYLHEESCGKCVFCREGTRQALDILNDIVECRAEAEQVELLVELGEAMKTGSICTLGRRAFIPVSSAMAVFAEDFKSHLDGKCCSGQTA